MGIKSIEEIEKIVANLKSSDKNIVTTNGSYDILHSGHINILKKSKNLGDILIVLLNSDSSIRRNKGTKRPIISQDDRAYLLSELKPVDYVVIFPQDTPLEYLERIKPDYHIKGGSYIPEKISEEKSLVEGNGGIFKTFPLDDGFSTTNIISKIINAHK